MMLFVYIPDSLITTPSKYMDIRLHKESGHINNITTSTDKPPYFEELMYVTGEIEQDGEKVPDKEVTSETLLEAAKDFFGW